MEIVEAFMAIVVRLGFSSFRFKVYRLCFRCICNNICAWPPGGQTRPTGVRIPFRKSLSRRQPIIANCRRGSGTTEDCRAKRRSAFGTDSDSELMTQGSTTEKQVDVNQRR